MRLPAIPALLERLFRGARAYGVIAALALLSAVMGVTSVGVMDVDEARFAQATRQMVETGDYVHIRIQEAERNRKPIGIHWLQAASVNLLEPIAGRTNAIWLYRLPSVLGAILAALAALWAGSALIGRRAAILGAALFSASMLIGFEGMTAKTDAVLCGFITLMFAALARLRMNAGGHKLNALVFWAALAAGVLIKGVVAPAAAVLSISALAIWERRADWARPLLWWPAPALGALIVAPWFIAIGQSTHGRFFADLLANEIGPKIAGRDHAHNGLPGYHLTLLPILIFPATYALPAAVKRAWRAMRAPPQDDAHTSVRFLIAWAAPLFLLFELLPGKLVHYTLPVYPALALLGAVGLIAMRGTRWRTAHLVGVALFLVAGAVLIAIMAFGSTLMPGDLAADVRRAMSTIILGAIALFAAVCVLLLSPHPAARAGALIACALALSYSLRERLLPESTVLFPSNEIADVLARERLTPNAERRLWSVGYDEPSLIFLTRTDIRLASPQQLASEAAPGDSVIVEGRELDAATALLGARALQFAHGAEPVRAFGFGRNERISLYFGTIEPALSGAAAADARQQSP